MEPISKDSVIQKDIADEVEKVKKAMQGIGDESYQTFSRIITSSNLAFNALKKDTQQQVVALQKVITQLRENENAQKALFDLFILGKISVQEFADAQTHLVAEQAKLKEQTAGLNQQMSQQIQQNYMVSSSLVEKKFTVAQLKEEYSRLSKEEKENMAVSGELIAHIQQLEAEINEINGNLENTKSGISSLMGALEGLPGSIGNGVTQLKQFALASRALLATPLGAIIGALAVAFSMFKVAVNESASATARYEGAMTGVKSAIGNAKQLLLEFSKMWWNMMSLDFKSLYVNIERVMTLRGHAYGDAKRANEASIEQDTLNKKIEKTNDLLALNNSRVVELRQKHISVTTTSPQSQEITNEITKLEKDSFDKQTDLVSDKYKVFKKSYSDFMRVAKTGNAEQLEQLNNYFKLIENKVQLTFNQKEDFIRTAFDITENVKSANVNNEKMKDVKAKLQNISKEAIDINSDYYQKLSNSSNQLADFQQQDLATTVNSAHDIQKTKLELLQEEISVRKQQYTLLAAYERSMGKEAAQQAFGELLAQGNNFTDYLDKKIKNQQTQPGENQENDINLGYLYQEKETNEKETFSADPFRAELESNKKFYGEDLIAYEQYLNDKRALNALDQSYAGQQKQLILDAALNNVQDEKQAGVDRLLNQYQSFATRLSSLTTSYQKEMSMLGDAKKEAKSDGEVNRIDDAIELRNDAYNTAMLSMETENAGFAKVLFGDISKMSKEALNKSLADARAFVAKWKAATNMTPEMQGMIGKVEDAIDKADQTVNADNNGLSKADVANNMKTVAASLGDCASLAGMFDGSLGSVIDTSAQVAEGAADIAGGIAQFSANPIQGAASMLSGVTKIISGIGKNIEENKKIRKEYMEGLIQTYSKELEYNSILRERQRLQQQVGETSLKYFERMQKELEKQKGSINKEYNDVWNKLMGEQYISKSNYKHGTWFKKAQTWNDYDSLAGKSYDEIESLYTQDKLEGSAKVLFERLKQLKEEGAEVVEMMDSLQVEMKEAFTGTTASAISDSIVQGFLDGKKSAADFADDFQGLMRTAMMQAVKMKYLEGPLNEWYDQFARSSEEGLTEEKIAALREQYNRIIENAAAEAENMEKITGIGFGGEVQREATQKGIASMSQDSADELNGRFTALQVITGSIDNTVSNIHTILYQAAEQWIKIEENTRHCRRLEEIEADMRVMKNGILDIRDNGLIMRK